MAKRKQNSSEEDFFKELTEATGGELLEDVGKTLYFIDTGNLALNYISSGKFIGGGVPGGKIIEVYGPPGGGKSLLGCNILAGCQRIGGIAVLLDCERAANRDFAFNAAHVDPKKLITYTPTTIEEVERKIIAVTRKIREIKGIEIPIVFVWDSISVVPTEREWKETELPENFTQAEWKKIVGGKEKPGERARAAGDALRKLNPFLDENNATLYIINQIRQTIGVFYGSDEVTAGGGKALPFYASCRMRVSATKNFNDTNGQSIGIKLNFRNKKNRSFKPFMTAEGVQLFYDCGVNPLGALLTALLSAGRIEASGSGNYKVKEEWADGNDVKFKAKKSDNLVPLEVLLECPKLVDATSKEELVEYLQPFNKAIELVASGDLIAEDIGDEASEKLGLDTDVEE